MREYKPMADPFARHFTRQTAMAYAIRKPKKYRLDHNNMVNATTTITRHGGSCQWVKYLSFD